MLENSGFGSFKEKFHSYITHAQNNFWGLAIAGSALLIVGGGYGWYRYSSERQNKAAYTILADCLSQYELAAGGKARFSDVVTMARAGYEKFSRTSFAPYILSIEVDSLLAEGKNQEAMERMNTVMASLSKESPLYSLYALKHALMKFDMPEAQDAALQELQKLAATPSDFSDAARYYLGLYYQHTGDSTKAVEVWKQLAAINEGITDNMARSPWASLAQSKISGLT